MARSKKQEIKGTPDNPGRGKTWVKPSKKKKGKKSRSYRRKEHEREATTVTSSKKIFHRAHPRRNRRTKDKIEAIIEKSQSMTLDQKRDLPLRDRRVLERRGLL